MISVKPEKTWWLPWRVMLVIRGRVGDAGMLGSWISEGEEMRWRVWGRLLILY